MREGEDQGISIAYGQRFRVGEVTVDGALHVLRMPDGRDIRLEPRLIRLLARLADARGEPVPRELLLAEVSNLPYAGDETLTQAISKLRQALGDSTKAPRYIKTIPRRGYALVASVSLLDGEIGEVLAVLPDETPAKAPVVVAPAASHPNQSVMVILALAILVLAGLLVWTVLAPNELVRETELILNNDEPLPENEGQEFIEKKDIEKMDQEFIEQKDIEKKDTEKKDTGQTP